MRVWEIGLNRRDAETRSEPLTKTRDSEAAEWTEIGKEWLTVVAVHSLAALIIFAVSRHSWWFAVVLLVLFAIQVLSRLVLTGFVFLILGLVVRLFVRFIRFWGLHPSKFDTVLQRGKEIGWLSLVMGSIELYLVLLTVLLGFAISW